MVFKGTLVFCFGPKLKPEFWIKPKLNNLFHVKGDPRFPVAFEKGQEWNISKNNFVGSLTRIGRQYVITFQLLLTAPSDYHDSIIHFTIGGDYQKYGDRTPGLWTANSKTGSGRELHLASAINGQSNYKFYPQQSLSLNIWHDIEISQIEFGSEVCTKYSQALGFGLKLGFDFVVLPLSQEEEEEQ